MSAQLYYYLLFILVRPWITPVFMAVPVKIQIHVTSDFIHVPVHVGLTGETGESLTISKNLKISKTLTINFNFVLS